MLEPGYEPAEIPLNEADRLAALRRYAVLDSLPEQAFDRITALAARLFEAPIALVSLVDEKRQWFKSCFGLNTRETSRDVGFCPHAIHLESPLVIPDATNDPRFSGNPLVTGAPHIRFYTGAPLKTSEGFNLGTLCVIDTRARTPSPDMLATLTDLAALVVDELELRLRTRELSEQRDLFQNVIQSAGDGIVAANDKGEFLCFNPAAERIIGIGTTDAVSGEWGQRYGLFRPDKVTPCPESEIPLTRTLRGETVEGVELFIRNSAIPQGAFLRINGRPMKDASGRPCGGIVTFSDMTELKAAQERLSQLATTDPLTGLPNRRILHERLDLLVRESARGRKFALIMCDLDHFKEFNDVHGHLVGDEALVAVSQELSGRVRSTDLVSRYGGEEFCLLLTDVEGNAAAKATEELRAAVSSMSFRFPVTASFGVCTSSQAGGGAGWIKAADDALYQAKMQGRNRVVLAQTTPTA